jgi:hypothetical protein
MKKTFAFPFLIILFLLSACNMPSESTSNIPEGFTFGAWNCTYMENGMYAGGPPITINQDGTMEFMAISGTWEFDVQTDTFTFPPEIPLVNAVYYPENNMLNLTSLPSQTFGGGTSLSCITP